MHSPTGVHSCDGICGGIPPSAGNPDASVSGQLADSCIIPGGSLLGKGQVLSLCQELGIVVNLEKSTLTPSQTIVYLGIRIDSQTFRALATPSRIKKVFSIAEEFLSSKVQSVKFWRVLLGHLASLSRLVPNGQLRMRALQLALKSRLGLSGRGYPGSLGSSFSGRPSVVVHRGSSRRGDLSSPELSRPNVLVRRLRPRLGGHGRRPVCFRTSLEGRVVSVFSDNTTAVAYLRRQGGTLSPALNVVAQRILRWAE